MPDEITNNQEAAPDNEGQVADGLGNTEEYDKLSTEDLKKLVKEGIPPKPKEEPAPEPPTEPQEELPPDLKGKDASEIAKAYLNIRKLHSKQDEELGNLRKFKEETENLNNQMKSYQIDATSRKIIDSTVKKMTDSEKQTFFDKLYEDPAGAIMPLISQIIQPIAVIQARNTNEAEIQRLVKLHEKDLVPFDEKAVNKIIANYTTADGRNELFDRYGSKAFEEGYKILRDQNLDSALERERKTIQEKAIKEAEELARKKLSTYTEPQGVASVSRSGSTDYETMPLNELGKVIGKPND
jgi:hypothetical protein